MKTIGVGIIGCGGRLRYVAKLLTEANERIRIVALCDPSRTSIRAARKELPGRPLLYDDYRDLVRHPDVQWVMIGSWNCYHREHAVAAFDAGKHVYCEKPLATTLNDCVAMRDGWRRSGLLFSVGFTLRYSPHYVKIKKMIERGGIGVPISLEFNETLEFNHGGFIAGDWRRLTRYAGSHLLEKCCHDMDLVNWYVGSHAVKAASFGGLDFFRPENARHIRRLGRDREGKKAYAAMAGMAPKVNPFTSDKDIVDNQVAILEYANGVRATFHTNLNAGIPERRMYICGTEGALRADLRSGTIELRRIGFDEKRRRFLVGRRDGHGGGDAFLARDLARSMTRGVRPKAGLEDGLKAAVTCFGIDRALETGKVVDLRPLWKRVGIRT